MSQAIAALCRPLTHGVYVIGVADGAVHNAFTAGSVMQCSFDPLLLAIAVHRGHGSYRLLIQGGAFSVSVLREDQMALATHFGEPQDADKHPSVAWGVRRGRPVFCDALAYFDRSLYGHHPAGDHEWSSAASLMRDPEPGAAPLDDASTGDLDGSERLFPDKL